jgi:starch-binding outer membrane protein, SusD/RagB family
MSHLRSAKLPMATGLLALSLAACDFEVVNPGPVTDSFLDNATAHQAMANGAQIILADGLRNLAYTSAAITREIFPAGSTGSYGITGSQQTGLLRYDDGNFSVVWNEGHRARAVAQNAVARFESNANVNVQGYRPAAEAALWAGYANRMLGESQCEAVRDGGGIEPYQVFFEDAEKWFTRAIDLASTPALANVRTAATAARASVRANRGNWAGAVTDARTIPDAFSFTMRYTTQEDSQYNRIFWATATTPYRAVTVWNTFYEQYYRDTKDPRTPYVVTPNTGDAAVAMLQGVTYPGVSNGRAPFYLQLRHDKRDSPHQLSTGWEMRLLEAEALLRDGQWQQALPLINKRRVALGLAPWTAASSTDAWTVYKRERGIELWLEGRRMADLRRWKENNSPGALHPLETAGSPRTGSFLIANQSLCYPIPIGERETNPNVPTNP